MVIISVAPIGVHFLSFQTLKLRKNGLFVIQDLAFYGLTRLKHLDLSDNMLTKAPSLSCVKNTLEKLELVHNVITHIDSAYFDLCKQIRIVSLQGNQLIEIPNIRSISNTISILSLTSNNVSSLKHLYGVYFPRLHILHLDRNKITSFCFPPVNFAPQLHQVLLYSNNLSTIAISDTDTSSQRRFYMSLGRNPWHCDGSLGWTQQCADGPGYTTVCMGWLTLDYMMICASPKNVAGLRAKEAGIVW